MSKSVSLKEKFNQFNEQWIPRIVGEFDNSYVKIFKAKGEFNWHSHDEGDEFFMVIKGQLTMKLRDGDVILHENEFLIVPKGVEHCPYAEQETYVLLIESKQLVNAGTSTPTELERL